MLQRNSRASGEFRGEFCCGDEKWPHRPLSMAGAAWERAGAEIMGSRLPAYNI